jgi:hypothetical protein
VKTTHLILVTYIPFQFFFIYKKIKIFIYRKIKIKNNKKVNSKYFHIYINKDLKEKEFGHQKKYCILSICIKTIYNFFAVDNSRQFEPNDFQLFHSIHLTVAFSQQTSDSSFFTAHS